MAIVAGGLVFWVYDENRAGISLPNYEKIQKGMTELQVELLLGGPPGWEVSAMNPKDEITYLIHNHGRHEWWGRDGVVTVHYVDGVVFSKFFKELPFEPKPRTIWERLPFRGAQRE